MIRVPLLVLAGLASPAFAQAEGPGGYGYHMHEFGWAGMVMGPLMMLLFIGLAVALGVALLRWLGALPSSPKGKSLQILEERFARGDIDAEEFEARRRALES